MKKALVTICTGDAFKQMAKVSHPTFKAYAEKCGADFIVLDDQKDYPHAGFLKYDMFDLPYDRIMYVDTDILIRDDCPNLFEKIPERSFAAFNEGQFLERRDSKGTFLKQIEAKEGSPHFDWAKSDQYFNTGVLVFDTSFPMKKRHPFFINNFYEQTQFNNDIYLAAIGEKKDQHNIVDLHYKYNRMSHMDKRTGEPRFDSYIMHYAGAVGPDGDRASVAKIMKKDLEYWEDRPKKYKKNFFITAYGGLGDVVASEPVVRFISEKMYKDQNIVLKSSFPEVFEHLEGVKIVPKNTTVPDVGYYEIELMPKAENPVNNFLTHALCHPVDYASMMAFKGQMPNALKQIKLQSQKLSPEIEENLKETVLFHCGRGWPSKTFPSDWWNSVLEATKQAGYRVGLIGKNSESQGTVDVSTEGCDNYIDQFNLHEVFRAIELAPVLITNDSSPVHIAGAFDNWVGILPTCKHPDRILPWRKNSQRYKASVLSTNLINREFRPTSTKTVSIDVASEEEVRNCLPTPEQVVDWLRRIPSGLKADKLGE